MMNIQPRKDGVVPIAVQFELGIKYWNGQVDTDCALSNPGNEWMCCIDKTNYKLLRSQIFHRTQCHI